MKIRLNIGGAFAKKTQLVTYIFNNRHLLDKFEITVFDGINNCPWNGGRINRDIMYDDSIIDFYYRNKISIALTFTNPVIDLTCETGNHLLEKFHRTGNCIITVNDALREYVKTKYPKFKHTRSITSFGKIKIPMSDSNFDRYKKLEEQYDYIVPRMEHVFDDRFIELNMSKYEVMVNDTCVYGCPLYGEHFEKIAEQNRLYEKPWHDANPEEMKKIEGCWLPHFDPCIGHKPDIIKYGDNYGMDLTIGKIKRLMTAGVTNFKITGREMSITQYQNELNMYLQPLYEAID